MCSGRNNARPPAPLRLRAVALLRASAKPAMAGVGWSQPKALLLAAPERFAKASRRSRQGFTLIELVIVAAIISILAAAVILMLPDFQPQRERMAARELMKHLRYIQNMTMNRERTTRVVFSVVSNSYAVSIADTNGAYVPAKDPASHDDWVVVVGDRFSGVQLSSVNINGNNVLYFNVTNGIPCDISTNTPIASTGTVTFLSGLSVRITPVTGYVRITE